MTTHPQHKRLHILVVAKRLHTGRAIANRLSNIGYKEVISFQTAEDALNFLEHGRTDLVIVTKNLKDIESYKFAEMLRAQGKEDIPIILACEQITHEEFLEAVEHGVNDVIVEPHRRNKFVEKIKSLHDRYPRKSYSQKHLK